MVHYVNDEELMIAYRDGDGRAFEILYGRYRGPLYRFFLRQCRLPEIAEELFQDVWMKLIQARARYEPRAKFSTYLFHIGHNLLLDYYRRTKSGLPRSYDSESHQTVLERVPDVPARQPENELESRRLAKQLQTLIQKLPEAQREVFLLRQETGLSLEQIAEITDVHVETTKSRLRYAIAKLREGLNRVPKPVDTSHQRSGNKPTGEVSW